MSQVSDILRRDKELFFKDLDVECNKSDTTSQLNLIADFTEYNPLHNGHFHCMKTAKHMFPESLFVAIVPGLFERSGRGIPYILPALNTTYIPRGYKPLDGFDEILKRINMGHHIAPKPYRIVDKTTNEVILRDKLEEDNYVITSFSNSLSKIGFDYTGKFIFVERIEGVSGTLIRESIMKNNFDDVLDMMPPKTIEVLKREIENDSIIYGIRDIDSILDTANNFTFEQLADLNLFNDKLARNIIDNRPYDDIDKLEKAILHGFSSHFRQRVLSILENPIPKKIISQYIDKYPSNIRILGYKNKESLEKFIKKVNNENISLFNELKQHL